MNSSKLILPVLVAICSFLSSGVLGQLPVKGMQTYTKPNEGSVVDVSLFEEDYYYLLVSHPYPSMVEWNKFDYNHKMVSSKKWKMIEGDSKLTLVDFLKTPSKTYAFMNSYPKGPTKTGLKYGIKDQYSYMVEFKDGEFGEKTKIHSVQMPTISRDSSHIGVLGGEPKKGAEYQHVSMYDENMGLQWKTDVSAYFEERKKIEIHDLFVSDDGSEVFISFYHELAKKQKGTNRYIYQVLRVTSSESQVIEIPVEYKKIFMGLHLLRPPTHSKGTILVKAPCYRGMTDSEAMEFSHIFLGKLDFNEGKLHEESFRFTPEQLNRINKDIGKVLWDNLKLPLSHVITYPDGSFTLISEAIYKNNYGRAILLMNFKKNGQFDNYHIIDRMFVNGDHYHVFMYKDQAYVLCYEDNKTLWQKIPVKLGWYPIGWDGIGKKKTVNFNKAGKYQMLHPSWCKVVGDKLIVFFTRNTKYSIGHVDLGE